MSINFKNGLEPNLMVVSGAETGTSYTAANFSSKEADVIKVVFKDPWRNNFRTAYDPTNTSETKTGFRIDAFDAENKFNIAKHFRVKQIDPRTGAISAEGIALRWIPGSLEEGGGGTLFIKQLFHQSQTPSQFNSENGVIFCNEVSGFTVTSNSVTKEFAAKPSWAGSAIKSVQNLSNVYKLTTTEPFDTPTNAPADWCPQSPQDLFFGIGMYQPGDRVYLKRNTSNPSPCSETYTSKGIVLSAAIDTSSGKISVFVQFDDAIPTNHTGTSSPTGAGPAGCTTDIPCSLLCVGTADGSCAGSCASYRISNIRLLSSPECGTVQKIVFADEIGPDYSPGYELWQWKWELAGNHLDNGGDYQSPANEQVYKIKGEYINWDKITKTLYVICPNDLMDVKYGNVYQKTNTDSIIYRGSAIDIVNSKFERKSGIFVNIANNKDVKTYVPGKEYKANWDGSGEQLIQITQGGETSYSPRYEYAAGETIIQVLHEDETTGEILEYAAGKVIAWEPNLTALRTIPSKLVIKRYETGTELPENFETNNPLIPKNKILARFRFGPGLAPAGVSTSSSILKRSKRYILPLRIYKNLVNTNTIIKWYDFSSPFCKQNSLTTDQKDPEGVSIPITFQAKIAGGSSVGTTRLKAIQYYSDNEYKFHLLDSNIVFNSPVSFADVSNIGRAENVNETITETDGEYTIQYQTIYPVAEISQENVNGKATTVLYQPLEDKMIYPLPGGLVMENTITGEANLGQSELTIQQLYNVDFNRNESQLNTITLTIEDSIPNAEFVNTFSSSYAFATDIGSNQIATDEKAKTINLIKYNDLQSAASDVQPSDYASVYYDTLESNQSTPRVDTLILRRKTPSATEGISKLLVGAEIKVKLSDIVKNKTKTQFTQTVKLKYHKTGEFKGKWIADLTDVHELHNLISVYFVTNGVPTTDNVENLFGISKQVNDYFYKNSKLILSPDALINNTNQNPSKGPVYYEVPQIPQYGSFVQDDINQEYYIELSVTGNAYSIPNSGGVILRESYKDYNNNVSSVREIPFYKSTVDGKEYHGSALLDFRPTLDAAEDAVNNTKCVVLPASSTVNTELGVYMPRKDLLYISKNGQFKFMYGEPSSVPLYPTLPESGMVLYRIDKPAYIFSSKDLSLQYTENKRYTMRDIGRIEKRVEQLEVYSTLSLLEKNAETFLVQDTEGNNRFKNGIIVDPFSSHKVGDVSHPDYAIAIDPIESCIRPRFENTNVSLVYNNGIQDTNKFIEVFNSKVGATNNNISTGLYMLPYTEVPFVVQPQATRSISVTPFDTVQDEGILRLSPREDDWVDTQTLPDLNVNLAGENDVWEDILDELNASPTGPFGLQFGNWTEISRQTTTRTQVERTANATTTTTTSTANILQNRTVTGTELTTNTENVSLGERIVNMSLIPYMRGKRIMVVGNGLKPQTRMYPFFDGIEVSQHCYAYSSLEEMKTAVTNSTLDSTKKFSNGIQKTNSQGDMFIIFDMPTGIFRTGDRKFSISDNQNNDFSRASSFATGTYSASGLSQVRQTTNATIRNFETQNIQRTESRADVVTSTTVTRVPVRRSRDPLAQTFEINPQLYPNGIFLSSIDVFFARKPSNDTNIPVQAELRPTLNGFPDINRIHAGGTCILHPNQVNVSDFPAANEPATATRFTFEYPVYLEPGEHSFVIRSTTEEYEVYVAEIGQNLLNSTQRVTEQPYVGVFFMSSNASTWLPRPEMDMMMVMNKCEFPVNQTYTFKVESENIGKELRYEIMNLNNSYQEFDAAKISWSMGKTASADTQNITANLNVQYTNTQVLAPNERLYFKATGLTTNRDVTPVINKERLSSFFVKNIVENNSNIELNGELDPYANQVGSNGRSRYITKIVTLEEGFESSGFKLVLSVNKPIGTKIQAFLKYQTVEQTRNFHENSYVQLVPKMGANAFDNYYTQYEDEYVDVEFDLPLDSPIEYNKFVIKICLYSENPAYVPKVKDLRGIAVL